MLDHRSSNQIMYKLSIINYEYSHISQGCYLLSSDLKTILQKNPLIHKFNLNDMKKIGMAIRKPFQVLDFLTEKSSGCSSEVIAVGDVMT